MQISWDDLHRPTTPGDYAFLDGIITVTNDDIEIWKAHPDATFKLVPFNAMTGRKCYLLGMADYQD
jgi:hypothetical protein